MKKLLLAFVLISALFLTSCSRTQVGWVATNIGDTFEASYRLLMGRKSKLTSLSQEKPSLFLTILKSIMVP